MTEEQIYGAYNTGLPTHIEALNRLAKIACATDPVKEEMYKALIEAHALNKNWVADPEVLEYYSEYKIVLKRGSKALTAYEN